MFSHDKYASRIYHQGSLDVLEKQILGGNWFWTFGITDGGKAVVLGPIATEEEAMRRGEHLNDTRAFELPTRNQARATKMIRSILLEEGMTPDEVLQRQLHEKGLQREMAKKS